MQQSRAVVCSAAWRRASLSSTRRFKATLQVGQEEKPTADVHQNLKYARRREDNRNSMKPDRSMPIRLDKLTKAIIEEIRPGTMDYAVFGQAKSLVVESCKKGKPELATRLLDRMIDECRHNPKQYELYRSLFNVTMSAWAQLNQPEQTEQVFAQMLHSHTELPNLVPAPDRYSYNALLSAWSGSKSPIAIDRVLEILQEMEESDHVQPDAYTYNIVMTSYSNRSEYGSAKAAEDILLRFSERHVRGVLDKGPETMSFNIVMKAWSNSGDEKGPVRAMEIYSLMEKLNAEGHEHVKPDSISLIALMSAYVRKGDIETVEKLLRETKVDGDLTNCFNCAITAHAKSRHVNAGDRAEQLLAEMENPDEVTYSIVLSAHAQADRPDAAHRCEDFLGRTVERYLKYQTDMRPSKKLFHIVLRAWKEHGDEREAAERSLALLRDMQGLAKEWLLQTKPDASTWSFAHELWSQVDVHKAVDLLREAEKVQVVPFVRSYNAVLTSLAAEEKGESIEKALGLLERMEKNGSANAYGYNYVLHGLTKMPGPSSKRKSLELLERMEKAFRDGDMMVRPNMLTYSSILNSLSREPIDQDAKMASEVFDRMKRLHNDPQARYRLDLVGHRNFLLLLSRVRSGYAAEKATEVLDLMLSEGYPVYPDGGCMSSVILANARAPSARYTHIAHDRLLRLMKLHLDGKTKHYPHAASVTSVLHAWSRCRDKHVVERAYELLNVVKEMHEAGVRALEPNEYMYCAFFSVLANSDHTKNGEDAEKILDSLGFADVSMWNLVLRVWGRSNSADKIMQTRRCLRKMQSTEGAPLPDAVSFNTVLNCAVNARCNGTEQKLEALNVAIETFEELKMCQNAKPDHVSYGTMIQCYRVLMEPSEERTAAIRENFELCKAEGFVGELAIRELQASLTPKDFSEALGDAAGAFAEKQNMGTLLKKWTRNIPSGKR